MKRSLTIYWLAVFSLAIMLAATAVGQQSLGDVARQTRKNKPTKPTTKVVTNESLGSEVPSRAAEDDSKDADDSKKEDGQDKDKEKKDDKKLSAEEQAKLDKDWQAKIDAQNNEISMSERELSVMQRENKLRAADYYADAGTRLRDEKKFADDDRKYQDDVAAKQKAIDDAKTKLEQMREEARKAGANVS